MLRRMGSRRAKAEQGIDAALLCCDQVGTYDELIPQAARSLSHAAMRTLHQWRLCRHGHGSAPMVPFWVRCTTHFRTYFSGDCDVTGGTGF